MAEYVNKQVIELNKVTEENRNRLTRSVKTETHLSDGRLRLYRLAAVCFGVLCVLQVTLNISLRLAFCERRHLKDRAQNTCQKICNSCQEGWRLLGSSCYFLSTQRKTWQESRQDCLNRGADLVIINSEEERKFLCGLNKIVWIGLTDSVTGRTWKWMHGTPLTTASYWRSGGPYGGGVENCAVVRYWSSGYREWSDYQCSNPQFWICEKGLSSVRLVKMAKYVNKQVIELNEVNEENRNRLTRSVKTETHLSDRRLRLYRLAAGCFGVLCVLQVTLNISLRLAFFHSNREREQLNGCYNTGLAQVGDQPDTSSIMDLCTERDQCRMNRNQLERERDNEKMDKKQLLERNTALATERDRLRKCISLLTNEKVVPSICGTERVVEGSGMAVQMMRTVLKCPTGWKMLGSRCYFLSTERKTWQESRLDCLNREADLVIINSRQEQKLLYQLHGDADLLVWIGLTDSVNEGTWIWVDSTPLTTSYWKRGKPDHGGTNNKDCVEVNHRDSVLANWNDAPCNHMLRWICEKLQK
ncbi:uncharacterized protein LOC135536925 [Oncorhynchus masou masou]|uniref:uncharacterized protein LOC135536925 n=1 Tax=Oncorhynchus masou masou TaxID=90313 RepID=UPI0031840749